MSIDKTKLGKALKKLYALDEPGKVQDYSIEQFIYGSYIKAWQMMREKRNELLYNIDQKEENPGENFLYDIPGYLAKVCQMLRKLLAGIAQIDYREISVKLLYQMPANTENVWGCIEAAEKSQMMDINISDLMNSEDIQFPALAAGDISHYYTKNNKAEHKGSSFGTRADFEYSEKKYVNGILLIATCKQDFEEVERYCQMVGKTFENVLVYSILPYFIQLIQTEFGSWYMWEQFKDKKR